MSLLDGGLAALFGAALGAVYVPATLAKTTETDNGTGGFGTTTVAYPVRALVEGTADRVRAASGLPDTVVTVSVLRAGLAVAVDLDDALTVSARVYRVVRVDTDPAGAAYRGTMATASAGSSRDIVASGLDGFADDWFTGGTLVFSTGANAAIPFEVKSHRRTSGIDVLELWLPPPFPVAAGDPGTVTAGCRKTLSVCRRKFDNVNNFRGHPHIPGTDVVTRYGVQGALGQAGGSLFGGATL